MSIVLLLLIQGVALVSYAQHSSDTVVQLHNLPLKAGYVYAPHAHEARFYNPLPYVYIYSKDSTIGAVMNGVVERLFKVRGKDYVMIKNGDTTIVYGNFDKIVKGNDDQVQKGELIGTVAKDDNENRFKAFFQMYVRGRELFFEEQLVYLRRFGKGCP